MNGDISTIAVVGLGYVGLPLAAAFSKHFHVIGYDVNEEKLDLYKKGVDPTGEIGEAGLKECTILLRRRQRRSMRPISSWWLCLLLSTETKRRTCVPWSLLLPS